MHELLIKNTRLSSATSSLCNVYVAGGKIVRIGNDIGGLSAQTLDANGLYLLPGFVDMHFHGAGGVDFCDASLDGLAEIAKFKLREGVTTIVPATLTLPESDIAAAFETAKAYIDMGEPFCRIAGIHVEGPFINPKMAGAQNPDFFKMPDSGIIERLAKIFKILKVSYSVELDPSFSATLLGLGIKPSCVHSAATYAEFMKAYSFGLRNISHFGNRLSPITSRDIGATGAGLLHDDVFIEIIADRHHLSDDMLRLILAKKPHSKIALITDSMRSSGMPDGKSSIGGLAVTVADGQARLINGSLAGSVLKMNVAVKNIMEVGGITIEEATSMASGNVADSLGLEGLGKIKEGFSADLVIADSSLEIHSVIVGGEIRYQK